MLTPSCSFFRLEILLSQCCVYPTSLLILYIDIATFAEDDIFVWPFLYGFMMIPVGVSCPVDSPSRLHVILAFIINPPMDDNRQQAARKDSACEMQLSQYLLTIRRNWRFI